MDRTDGGFVVRHRPLHVDCTYLVTVWSTQSAGLKAAEEHRLLGLVLLWLGRFDVVDTRFLRGDLIMPPQLHPLPVAMGQVKEGQAMGQFWTALEVPPRLAFPLTVTIGLQPFEEAPPVAALKTIEIRPTVSDQPALSRRVLDATLAPLPGIPVTLVENGAVTTADPFGAFTFRELTFGSYTLLVRVAGRATSASRCSHGPIPDPRRHRAGPVSCAAASPVSRLALVAYFLRGISLMY